MRILFIEDNRQLAEQLSDGLKEMHYAIDLATDGQQGWDLVKSTAYDLVLMDYMLPKLDGISLCRRIRAEGYQTPILMLTARATSQDQIQGLDSGADDYLAKPVGIHELSARIRALLRRGGAAIAPILQWGNLQLDPSQCEVKYRDRKVPVTPKEYALLELMLRNRHQVLNRKAILEGLWSYEDDVPDENTVKAHVKGLRQKLRAAGADDLIETVYGLGYRLNSKYLKSIDPILNPEANSQGSELLELPIANLFLEKLLHLAKRFQHSLCHITLELDHWEKLDQAAQADLVEQMSQLLTSKLHLEDVVAYAGEAKFVVGLYSLTCKEAFEQISEILETLQQASFSAGVAAFPKDGLTLRSLAQLSELTLQKAKRAGGNRIFLATSQPNLTSQKPSN